jgi:hypothetical protein
MMVYKAKSYVTQPCMGRLYPTPKLVAKIDRLLSEQPSYFIVIYYLMSMYLADDSVSYYGSPLHRPTLIFLYLTFVLNYAVLAMSASCFYGEMREFILPIRIFSATSRFRGLLNSKNWKTNSPGRIKTGSEEGIKQNKLFLFFSLVFLNYLIRRSG